MYEKELAVMKECAKIASQIIKKYYHTQLVVNYKKDFSEVTEADKEIQKAVEKEIKSVFPGDLVKGEESKWKSEKSERTWLIDPIDGTIDFIEKNGEFSLCLAFLKNNEPVVSLVAAPILKKEYHAVKGQGAHLNNQLIKVSNKRDIKTSKLVISRHLGKNDTVMEKKFASSVRHGSTALRLCLIAEGQAEAYIYSHTQDSKLFEWDVCAGDLILHEAGGKVSDLEGKKISYNQKDPRLKKGLVATNGFVHDAVIQLI